MKAKGNKYIEADSKKVLLAIKKCTIKYNRALLRLAGLSRKK